MKGLAVEKVKTRSAKRILSPMIRIKKVVKKREKKEKKILFEDYIRRVELKAYELFEQRGRESGREWEDWFMAERIVEQELVDSKK